MTRRPWTHAEIAALTRLAAAGLKDAAVGRRLGRSRTAVEQKRLRLGLACYRHDGRDDALIRRLARDGWYDAEIGERIGRSRWAVRNARHRLGITAGRYAPPPRVDKRRAA